MGIGGVPPIPGIFQSGNFGGLVGKADKIKVDGMIVFVFEGDHHHGIIRGRFFNGNVDTEEEPHKNKAYEDHCDNLKFLPHFQKPQRSSGIQGSMRAPFWTMNMVNG